MSKDTPEVGDVWIYRNKTIMSVIKVKNDEIDCLFYENKEYQTYSFQKEHFIEHGHYFGHSKATIDDLFKTEE